MLQIKKAGLFAIAFIIRFYYIITIFCYDGNNQKIELSMYQNVQKRTLSAINYWRTIDQVLHFEKVLLIKIEKIPDKVSMNRPTLFGVLVNSRENGLFSHCF